MNIGIISLEIGNVASVKNMMAHINLQAELLTSPPDDNVFFDWIILPGVGSYDNGVTKLRDSGWFTWLKENHAKSNDKAAILGICLGMQLLCDGSEEGNLAGLSFIPGYFKKFNFENVSLSLKIPHMCWNDVTFSESKTEWGQKVNFQNPRYYFVHSYHYTNNSDEFIIGKTHYGYDFGSAIKKNNVIGFQFHPEKSHKHGKCLLSEVFKCQN